MNRQNPPQGTSGGSNYDPRQVPNSNPNGFLPRDLYANPQVNPQVPSNRVGGFDSGGFPPGRGYANPQVNPQVPSNRVGGFDSGGFPPGRGYANPQVNPNVAYSPDSSGSSGIPGSIPGSQEARSFRTILSPEHGKGALIVMSIVGALFGLLVAAVLASFMSIFTGSESPVLGALLPVGAIAGLVGIYFLARAKMASNLQQKELILTPAGLVGRDQLTVISIPWSGITHTQITNSGMRTRANASSPIINAFTKALNRAQERHEVGIIGRGAVAMKPGLGLFSRNVLRKQLGWAILRGPIELDSLPIWPGQFEEEWYTGEIGMWLRYYRPDIYNSQSTFGRYNNPG